MIRCVAYYGDVIDEPTRSEVERIAHRTRNRNADLGITGCLFYFGRYFVQVLEGHIGDVDRVYGTIVSDTRHSNVIGLVDNIVQARAFSNWSLKFVGGASPQVARSRERPPPPGSTKRFDVAGARADAAAFQRLAGDFELHTTRHLRVVPQQPRARQTVERLLDSVNRMISSSVTLDGLSLETAAANAGVTPQSAYRYFANIEDLVRAGVRRMQAHWHARFLDFMMLQTFESEVDIANATVAFIAETYETQVRASGKLKDEILRNYHDVDYDAAWVLSDAIVASIVGTDAPPLRGRGAEIAAGLTALWAVAKSLVLRDAALLGRPAVQYTMAAIFLAALGGHSPLDLQEFAGLV